MGVVGALLGGALLGGIFGSRSASQAAEENARRQQEMMQKQQEMMERQKAAAQPAAPAADSAQRDRAEELNGERRKARRGKKGLLVNPLNSNAPQATGGSGTGLNI